MTRPRILIADQNRLLRQGLRELCAGLGGCVVVGDVETAEEAVSACRVAHPDVIVIDLAPPALGGVEAIRRIIANDPAARVIALTTGGDETYKFGAIRAGVRAFLLKTITADELTAAVHAVHRGEDLIDPHVADRVRGAACQSADPRSSPTALYEREIAILRLVAHGLDNRAIATELHCSENAVSSRLRTVFSKIGVTNRTQAALYTLRRGWVTLDDPSK